jgi:acetoin utilization deacetylase AcuC-like enzyme
MILFFSPRFAEHTPPPGHPEQPDRAGVFAEVAGRCRARGWEARDVRAARREELERVHTSEYVAGMLRRAGVASMIDGDTYTSPETIGIACLAAGAAIDAVQAAIAERRPALALVRPPGHHAEPARAMGFCIFNNAAIAARVAADAGHRVAVLDIDVHHGNGTQAAFERDPAVFYASTHQHPYYPGTGDADQRGLGEGRGTTLNVPLPAGTGDAEFEAAYVEQVLPAVEAFGPDVLVVSAGFDAHMMDPLGGLRVSTAGYRRVMEQITGLARRSSEGRVAWVTEGGYHLGALGECLDALVDVLSGPAIG